MMNLIRGLYARLIASSLVRHGVFPTSADTVAAAAVTLTAAAGAWTWGAWTQIVAAAGVTVTTQIRGFTLENPVFGVAALQGEVAVAIGAGGLEVEVGRYPVASPAYEFAVPIAIPIGTRLSARLRTSDAVANTIDIKLLTATGLPE